MLARLSAQYLQTKPKELYWTLDETTDIIDTNLLYEISSHEVN